MSTHLLQDRTAILTGDLTTFNRSIARALTGSGANVAFLQDASQSTSVKETLSLAQQIMDEREINERFGRASRFEVNWSDPQKIKDSVSRVAETFGSVDIYIDGFLKLRAPQKFADVNLSEVLPSEIHQNLTLPLQLTQILLPYLKARKRGRIIYLLQDHALIGLPQHSLAAASRSGLIAFSKVLARELVDDRISCNCLSIGTTEDYLLDYFERKESLESAKTKLKAQIPWIQIADTERIAQAVCFLANPQSHAMNGQTLVANEMLSL
jgi:NAD(P)-dependent dehydrogenase (short-subunit alcohol dehydrogenase family)